MFGRVIWDKFSEFLRGWFSPKVKNVVTQFAIFEPLSYCFEETIEIDIKASVASRPVSCLIRWYNKPIQFHGTFHGLKITNRGTFVSVQTCFVWMGLSSKLYIYIYKYIYEETKIKISVFTIKLFALLFRV